MTTLIKSLSFLFIMELKDYIGQIKVCEDIALKEEYGLLSTFPVLLNTDFDKLVDEFIKSEKWHFGKKEKSMAFMHFNGDKCYSTITVGTPIGRFLPVLTGMDVISPHEIGTKSVRKYREEQLKNFKVYLILESTIRSNSRQLVSLLEWIGEYVMDKKIPACLPHSVGSNYDLRGDKNLERIVYYN